MDDVRVRTSIMESPLWCLSSAHLKVWLYLGMAAAKTTTEGSCNGVTRALRPGQLLATQRQLAEECFTSRQTVKRTLAILQRLKAISIEEVETQAIVITIGPQDYRDFRLPKETKKKPIKEAPIVACPQMETPQVEDPRVEMAPPQTVIPPRTVIPSQTVIPGAGVAEEPIKPKKTTDQRIIELRAIWVEEYSKAYLGAEYHWSPADNTGLHRIINVEPEEFRARAKLGLKSKGWEQCATVAELTSSSKWNRLVPAAARRKELTGKEMPSISDFENPAMFNFDL